MRQLLLNDLLKSRLTRKVLRFRPEGHKVLDGVVQNIQRGGPLFGSQALHPAGNLSVQIIGVPDLIAQEQVRGNPQHIHDFD